VKEQLRLLNALQEIDSAIVKKIELIETIPKKISSIEHVLKDAQALHDKQRQQYEALDKKKKDKERSLDEIAERIRKLKARASEIKNNKEYQAHLKEIASVEKEQSAIEDEILVLMESTDAALKDLKRVQTKVDAERERIEEYKKKLNEEIAVAEKELAELRLRRNEGLQRIDNDVYELYSTVLESKGGLAVVEARDEICRGCNMNIPPQLFVELKKNEKIIQCPQCGRILCWRGEGDAAES
jgi:predicted  nucleic acid-binding Zn-ribbon protein